MFWVRSSGLWVLGVGGALMPWGCWNKTPPRGGLKATEPHFPTALGAAGRKPGVSTLLSPAWREGLSLASSQRPLDPSQGHRPDPWGSGAGGRGIPVSAVFTGPPPCVSVPSCKQPSPAGLQAPPTPAGPSFKVITSTVTRFPGTVTL